MKKTTLLIAALTLSACATQAPIVDMKGVKTEKYQADLFECQQYAAQRNPANDAIAGALLGALVGAAIGASIDDSFALGTAGVGAVAGTATGAGQGAYDQQRVLNDCLKGRGYKVLGGAR